MDRGLEVDRLSGDYGDVNLIYDLGIRDVLIARGAKPDPELSAGVAEVPTQRLAGDGRRRLPAIT